MSIQFACPSCARGYSVKDELAGKSAKCGQCGHKMTIPATATKAAVAAASASSSSNSGAAAAAKSNAAKSTAAKPVAVAGTKPTVVRPVSAKAAAAPTAKAKPAKAATDPGTSSWLDEELESARVDAKTKPKAPTPLSTDSACPSCNGPMGAGAVICVQCGYDKRIRSRRSVEHVDEDKLAPKRSKLGHMGSLLRGSFFSFLGAMVGAIIWAVLAYLTHRSFGIVAWGLGGLAGFGMALGHDDDDGTFAGIIAGCMSILGILAAKVFIVIILLAVVVSTIVAEMPVDAERQALDFVELQRSALASSMALERLEASGEKLDSLDDERFEQELEKAKAEVANLSPEEIETRLNELDTEEDGEEFMDGEEEFADEDMANDEGIIDEDEAALAEEEVEGPGFGALVGSLFRPMDGVWILLAFFTAYKVGSGQAED